MQIKAGGQGLNLREGELTLEAFSVNGTAVRNREFLQNILARGLLIRVAARITPWEQLCCVKRYRMSEFIQCLEQS